MIVGDLVKIKHVTFVSTECFPVDTGVVLDIIEDEYGIINAEVLLKNERWWLAEDELEVVTTK